MKATVKALLFGFTILAFASVSWADAVELELRIPTGLKELHITPNCEVSKLVLEAGDIPGPAAKISTGDLENIDLDELYWQYAECMLLQKVDTQELYGCTHDGRTGKICNVAGEMLQANMIIYFGEGGTIENVEWPGAKPLEPFNLQDRDLEGFDVLALTTYRVIEYRQNGESMTKVLELSSQ